MNERITINEAKAASGLSDNYIRKAIAKGDLKVEKELVPGTTNNWRNVILNFEEWRATRNHSQREDGRTKFVVYMTADEQNEIAKLIESMPFLATIARANVKVEAE